MKDTEMSAGPEKGFRRFSLLFLFYRSPLLFFRSGFFLPFLLLLPAWASLHPATDASDDPGEVLNRVVMIVGDMPVTEVDIDGMVASVKTGRIPLRKGNGSLERKALDELVLRGIVEREAERESILVSDAKIQNEIDRRKEISGLTSDEDFRKEVEKQTGMDFETWTQDMRFQLKKRNLIQLMVSVPRPSDAEVEAFYRKNRDKVGLEVSFREMILRPRDGSIVEERRISGLANDLRKKIARNPNTFSAVARDTADNASPLKYRGGYQPYLPIQEVAARHQMMAGLLYSMRPGEISTVYRDTGGNYFFAQLVGKRPVALSRVEDVIRQRLYFEKEEVAFDEWIDNKLKETSIICLIPETCSSMETHHGGYYPGPSSQDKPDKKGRPGRGR